MDWLLAYTWNILCKPLTVVMSGNLNTSHFNGRIWIVRGVIDTFNNCMSYVHVHPGVKYITRSFFGLTRIELVSGSAWTLNNNKKKKLITKILKTFLTRCYKLLCRILVKLHLWHCLLCTASLTNADFLVCLNTNRLF